MTDRKDVYYGNDQEVEAVAAAVADDVPAVELTEPAVGTLPPSAIPTPQELAVLKDMAETFATSQMQLRRDATTAGAILAKFLAGRELGIAPMAAYAEIDNIEGKFAMNARTMVALVRQRGLGNIVTVEATIQRVVVAVTKTEWTDGRVEHVAFTMEDAVKAELTAKKNWRHWPVDMMQARARSTAARRFFPELFLGVPYTADELEAVTDRDGTVGYESSSTPTPTIAGLPPAVPKQPGQPKPATSPVMQFAPTIDVLAKIRSLVDTLKFDQVTWSRFLARFGMTTIQQAGDDRKAEIASWLSYIHGIRVLRVWANVSDAEYQAALGRRGIQVDTDLDLNQAYEMWSKLMEVATPFDLQRLGLADTPDDSLAGKASEAKTPAEAPEIELPTPPPTPQLSSPVASPPVAS